jgi:speckle-type POZ protein
MFSSSESVLAGGDTPAHTASTIVAETLSGSHVLIVRGYSVTVGLGVDKILLSGSFSVGGHTWNMLYCPHGHDPHGDWISVGLNLCHTAAANFKIRCTFSILDDFGEPVPRYTTECRTATCFDKGEVMSFPTFIKRAELEESLYLKDDCFSVKCDLIVTKIRTEDIAQFVMVPPSDMHERFDRILQTGELADVTLEVSGETFAAHWCLLAARSSVFMEQFLPMKESADPHVQISNMDSRVFRVMLRFIYTDSLPELDDGETMEMAQRLFIAARRYNLEKLKLICENLLCNCIDTSKVASALLFAKQNGCVGLKKACFKFLSSFENLKAIIGSDGFEKLKTNDPNILEELVANVNAA